MKIIRKKYSGMVTNKGPCSILYEDVFLICKGAAARARKWAKKHAYRALRKRGKELIEVDLQIVSKL